MSEAMFVPVDLVRSLCLSTRYLRVPAVPANQARMFQRRHPLRCLRTIRGRTGRRALWVRADAGVDQVNQQALIVLTIRRTVDRR